MRHVASIWSIWSWGAVRITTASGFHFFLLYELITHFIYCHYSPCSDKSVSPLTDVTTVWCDVTILWCEDVFDKQLFKSHLHCISLNFFLFLIWSCCYAMSFEDTSMLYHMIVSVIYKAQRSLIRTICSRWLDFLLLTPNIVTFYSTRPDCMASLSSCRLPSSSPCRKISDILQRSAHVMLCELSNWQD